MAVWCGRRPFGWWATARMRRTVFRKRFWKPSKSLAGSRLLIGRRCCGIWQPSGPSICCECVVGIAVAWMFPPGRMVLSAVRPARTQEAEASELAERLRAALPYLSEDQAAVFCLSCLENLSYQEIGERLGMTANAVGVLLHRGRQRLRKLWDRPISKEATETEGSRRGRSGRQSRRRSA